LSLDKARKRGRSGGLGEKRKKELRLGWGGRQSDTQLGAEARAFYRALPAKLALLNAAAQQRTQKDGPPGLAVWPWEGGVSGARGSVRELAPLEA
jgi:hypothetical protein